LTVVAWKDSGAFGTVPLPTCALFAVSVVAVMDEARAVLERLQRIEDLERDGATARSLLDEVRALLAEAEAWVGSERGGRDLAEQALARCRNAVDRGSGSRPERRGETHAEAVSR
jgi:hypothetical protein